jgi:hypothetical protein
MGTISKLTLTGSNQGRPILIAASGATGTTIHTTLSSSTTVDEIWLYATNNDTVQRNLTIEYGTTGTASEISVGIPSKSGLSIILAGCVLTGTGSDSSVVRAYGSISNQISVVGYVNRLVP